MPPLLTYGYTETSPHAIASSLHLYPCTTRPSHRHRRRQKSVVIYNLCVGPLVTHRSIRVRPFIVRYYCVTIRVCPSTPPFPGKPFFSRVSLAKCLASYVSFKSMRDVRNCNNRLRIHISCDIAPTSLVKRSYSIANLSLLTPPPPPLFDTTDHVAAADSCPRPRCKCRNGIYLSLVYVAIFIIIIFCRISKPVGRRDVFARWLFL